MLPVPPGFDATSRLVALAARNPAHLDALVSCNSCIFLNPDAVGGDIMAPREEQLECYLSAKAGELSSTVLDAFEVALSTGVVEGAANGDLHEDEGELLDEHWREEPIEAWSAILRRTARDAKGCVVTPGGRCIGPLAIESWLEAELPSALTLLRHTLSEDSLAEKEVARLVSKLGGGIRTLGADAKAIARLLLVLHFWGTAFAVAPGERDAGVAAALAGVKQRLADEHAAKALRDLAFISSELAQQEADARLRELKARSAAAAPQPVDECAWMGDEGEAESEIEQLLELAVRACEVAGSA